MLCENAHLKGNGSGISVKPQCYNNKAQKYVTVVYHENPFTPSGEETSSFFLCNQCAEALKKDCEAHGYEVRVADARDFVDR